MISRLIVWALATAVFAWVGSFPPSIVERPDDPVNMLMIVSYLCMTGVMWLA